MSSIPFRAGRPPRLRPWKRRVSSASQTGIPRSVRAAEAPSTLRFFVIPGVDSLMHARRAIGEGCEGVSPHALTDILVVASELIAGSLVPATGTADDGIEVRLSREPGSVRIEVEDPGRRFGRRMDRPDGNGLALMATLTTEWGWQSEPPVVWAEFRT